MLRVVTTAPWCVHDPEAHPSEGSPRSSLDLQECGAACGAFFRVLPGPCPDGLPMDGPRARTSCARVAVRRCLRVLAAFPPIASNARAAHCVLAALLLRVAGCHEVVPQARHPACYKSGPGGAQPSRYPLLGCVRSRVSDTVCLAAGVPVEWHAATMLSQGDAEGVEAHGDGSRLARRVVRTRPGYLSAVPALQGQRGVASADIEAGTLAQACFAVCRACNTTRHRWTHWE